jgi:REP element-mobilizing transposase RayT
VPKGLHRYYGAGFLHFITTSCYRRLPLLGRARARDLFVAVLEEVRRRYHFVVVGFAYGESGVVLVNELQKAELKVMPRAVVPTLRKPRRVGQPT